MNGTCGAIIIDEAWMMLANEEFSKQLITWIKTFRKHNVAIVLATQSINDLSKASNIGDFLDCIKTRIFLPNKDANTETLKGFYKKLSLCDSQIDAICKALALSLGVSILANGQKRMPLPFSNFIWLPFKAFVSP